MDAQHSPYSDHLLISFRAGAEELGIPVQLRMPHTRDAELGRRNRLGLRSRAAPNAQREYAAWWNETVLLSIQIESVRTLTNIARLVRPGISRAAEVPRCRGDDRQGRAMNPTTRS
jgi:hypothetical protein